MSQAAKHASICAYLGTTPRAYNGDFHALFDTDGIAGGDFNGRLTAWICNRLDADIGDVNGAMAAYAQARNRGSWAALGDLGLTSNADALAFSRAVYGNGGGLDARDLASLAPFFSGMTTDGNDARTDRLWILALRNRVAALTCLYSGALAVVVGSMTHTPGVGVAFPAGSLATSGYLRTGYIPATHGNAYQLDGAHGSVWALSDASNSSMNDLGADGSTSTHALRIVASNNADAITAGVNNNPGTLGAAADSTGHTIATRRAATGAGAVATIRDGSSETTAATTSTGRPDCEIFIGARNNNGTAAGVGNPRGHFMASLGGALSLANGSAFYGRLATLKASLAA
jgi:hypothetical protein